MDSRCFDSVPAGEICRTGRLRCWTLEVYETEDSVVIAYVLDRSQQMFCSCLGGGTYSLMSGFVNFDATFFF